jgi:hypothetical protein
MVVKKGSQPQGESPAAVFTEGMKLLEVPYHELRRRGPNRTSDVRVG